MRSKIFILLALIICIFGYAKSKSIVDARLKSHRQYDIRLLPTPRTAAVLSMGFKNAAADIFWIEAINYFGWQLTKKDRTYKYLTSYLDLIFELDPYFTVFYDWAATAFIYNALPITRDGVIDSTRYVNKGIQHLNEIYRYDTNTIAKGAFNFAIETTVREHSIPYFELASRVSPLKRDLLLVASSYATTSHLDAKAYELKKEYLGYIAFEGQKSQVLYALRVLSSARFNSEAANFTRALRIKMETDEEIRKLVEQRLESNPFFRDSATKQEYLDLDRKVDNILSIDFSRNWLPPDLHALVSLRYR